MCGFDSWCLAPSLFPTGIECDFLAVYLVVSGPVYRRVFFILFSWMRLWISLRKSDLLSWSLSVEDGILHLAN